MAIVIQMVVEIDTDDEEAAVAHLNARFENPHLPPVHLPDFKEVNVSWMEVQYA